MSFVGGLRDGAGAAAWWLRHVEPSVRATIATLLRPPRSRLPRPSLALVAVAAAAAIAAVAVAMIAIDGPVLALARQLPAVVVHAFDEFTDLGLSGWFLWPTGLLVIAIVLLNSPAAARFSRGILAAWAVRLGFLFTAIAVPGLFVTIIKRLIGRARPFVEGNDGWAYLPFSWRVDYASLPSGHATTGFSALVAIGAMFPAARALMWTYAVLIALSRVVIVTHHPSDAITGAIVGAFGALLVRDWFAARRLGFAVRPNGTVYPMPGPSLRRIVKAVAQRLHSA